MARRNTVEDVLRSLIPLRHDLAAEDTLEALRAALSHKSCHVVAKAASLAGEGELTELADDLCTAFDRFMVDPTKTDKGCTATTAIAEALGRIEHEAGELFVRGARHVQLEPGYPESRDTAAGLRAACVLGLAFIAHPDAPTIAADLLADSEVLTRVGAARAVGCVGGEAAAVLLRFKLRSGDEEPEVIAECMSGLLSTRATGALELVTEFLDASDPYVQEVTAWSLGGSRHEGAFEPLRVWSEGCVDARLQRVGLLAVATMRCEDGFAYLLSVLGSADVGRAEYAIEALGMSGGNAELGERALAVARDRAARGDGDLTSAVREVFDSSPDAGGES